MRRGSLWHSCLAAWYRSQCTMTALDIVDSVIGPWWEARKAWHDAHPEDVDGAEDDKATAKTTTGMLDGYIAAFGDDMKHWKVLAVEPQMARWLVHPVTGKPLRDRIILKGKRVFRRWAYGGAMDLLVQLPDGSIWFMEHKTTKESNLDKYVRKLDWDPQIRGYAWSCADPILTVTTDVKEPLRISGVIYNVARTKVPQEPELMVKGGLSKAKDIDTTRALYMAAIKRHGLNPDAYADVLERLLGKTFFHREHYVFTDPELEDFGRDISHAALDVMASEHGNYFPRQQSVCTGIAPMPCEFKHICLSDTPMARKPFTVRGIRHVELTGDLAEDYVAQLRPVSIPDPPRPQGESQMEAELRASLASRPKPAEPDPFDAPAQEPVDKAPALYTIDPFAE